MISGSDGIWEGKKKKKTRTAFMCMDEWIYVIWISVYLDDNLEKKRPAGIATLYPYYTSTLPLFTRIIQSVSV